MEAKTEIAEIERRAREAGVTIKAILERADVASSQWVRWKQGSQNPMRTTWARVQAAADEQIADAAKNGAAAE